MIDFYFFHIGDEIDLPKMLVNSILKTNKNSRVFQLTDKITKKIDNTYDCYRFNGDKNSIMKFRMEAYSKTFLNNGRFSIFLDTDMLVLKEINLNKLFGKSDLILCKRELNANLLVNIDFNNMNMKEYEGKTMIEAWPYLGCFIGVKDSKTLIEMNQMYDNLENKYKLWYGDQIILKKYALENPRKTSFIGENEYACVPVNNKISKQANIIHFKGKKLKPYMKTCYQYFFEK
ncbi:hypothetical protein N9O66_03175 [Alphaproteobacteria bacterium]|jgi:hypothetical protein|nr:hypothetical protein [Alphaproteobacteria bacterium]